MSLYFVAKKAYRLLGSPFSSVLFSHETAFSRSVTALKSNLENGATHDEIYDRDYYQRYSRQVERTADVIADWVVSHEQPSRCIDVGCGSGEIMKALGERGIETYGYDNSEAALSLCREKGLSVEKLDLEASPEPIRHADLVISTEVAEHIPAAFAEAYVDFLAKTAPVVVVTAAIPGQGGTDHVNEQPNEYWIDKFQARGLAFDPDEVEATRKSWKAAGADDHRAGNLLIFRKLSP